MCLISLCVQLSTKASRLEFISHQQQLHILYKLIFMILRQEKEIILAILEKMLEGPFFVSQSIDSELDIDVNLSGRKLLFTEITPI